MAEDWHVVLMLESSCVVSFGCVDCWLLEEVASGAAFNPVLSNWATLAATEVVPNGPHRRELVADVSPITSEVAASLAGLAPSRVPNEGTHRGAQTRGGAGEEENPSSGV